MDLPKLPDVVHSTVKEAVDAEPTEAAGATRIAVSIIERLPVYKSIIESLVEAAIKHLVHDEMHRRNVRLRNELNDWPTTPKVSMASASVVRTLSHFNYKFACGLRLGSMKPTDLSTVIATESAHANVHVFNLRLAEALERTGVPEDKTYEEVLTDRQIKRLWNKAKKQADEEMPIQPREEPVPA